MKNKINVNISPNPLDLQTLHCSQNDTGERKFYFTLHNNSEVIDTSDISDPIFEPFSVYKGGTEQLLPVNTDDPTTSPIIADIQYPDEEKTEQEFTYRESPTTLDGNALVEKIYGNTLAWNQLIQNGNFADTSNWNTTGGSVSASNNVVTFTVESISGAYLSQVVNVPIGHKFFFSAEVKSDDITSSNNLAFGNAQTLVTKTLTNSWQTYSGIANKENSNSNFNVIRCTSGLTVGATINAKNCMLIDLTAMFGSTKADEIYAMEQSQSGSGVAYFRSLFPLNYYSYGQKLLPFKGTGVKVTGKNLIDPSIIEYGKNWNGNAVATRANYSARLPYGQYTFSIQSMGTLAEVSVSVTSEKYGERSSLGGLTNSTKSRSVTVDANNPYVQFLLRVDSGTVTQTDFEGCSLMLESGSIPTTYEPYTSSTTSIPTSTYFPNGMMAWGTAFDELTNSKAVHRMNQVDLGTLSWNMSGSGATAFFYADTTSLNVAPTISAVGYQNYVCSKYSIVNVSSSATDTGIGFASATQLRVRDTTYQSASDFATAMNGVMLQFELAEEQVTEFTHASLICEDGESTLYQDDDSLVCECTEDFSKDSGFKDCKIKFTNDDGVVYSNKIQLHIERKP